MVRAFLVVVGLVLSTGLAEAKPDFQNFTYKPGCLGSLPVRMKKGAGTKDGMTLAVSDVVEGDLDGDGKPEYTVLLACDADEGTGRFTEGFVYRIVGGKPVLAVALPTGDRAHGGILSVKVDGGQMEIDRDTTSDGACCAEWTLTQRFKLVKNKLVEVGLSERALPDGTALTVSAVKFDKGSSSWTRTTDQSGAGSEFVLAARAKQKLVATVTAVKGKPRLVVFDDRSFLPRTIMDPDALTITDTRDGDGAWHVIVAPPENATDTKLTYKITISIQ